MVVVRADDYSAAVDSIDSRPEGSWNRYGGNSTIVIHKPVLNSIKSIVTQDLVIVAYAGHLRLRGAGYPDWGECGTVV